MIKVVKSKWDVESIKIARKWFYCKENVISINIPDNVCGYLKDSIQTHFIIIG